jgi:uncharacterized membrane protein
MDRLSRIFKHRWLDEADVRRALPADALARLTAAVAASEQHHSGEIRICVEAGLPWSYLRHRRTAHDRALMMFSKLRVWDTEHNNGVLVYLLLAEHTVEIVADRGLNAQASSGHWAAIIERMKPALHAGRFEEGLMAAIAAIDGTLRQGFARRPEDADHNELPDAPFVN